MAFPSSLHRVGFCVLAAAVACASDDEAPDPGALITVTMQSRVGVLLDEIPATARARLAADLLARPAAFWEVRARRQISTALYRLVYRHFYGEGLGQLPLPPASLWRIQIQPAERVTIDGHDLVVAPYAFSSTLLTPTDEPGLADARLARIGGVVEEAFVLPADPEHLLERTGYACMNESDFPPNSVDTENAPAFFDDTCAAGDAEDGCHLTPPIPTMSCVEALEAAVGRVDVTFRFERAPWSDTLAASVRVGEPRAGGAQLKALEEGVADHRIVYRYFSESSCAIDEGCVGAPGWRRLLQFTASMHNVGDEDVALGDVGFDSPVVANNMVSFSACHQHMHFNHYGDFRFGQDDTLGAKRAFCLESTSRYSNNETTPLVHPHSCEFQGTARGWGDDYIAGLDCQWVDITTVDATGGLAAPLTFEVNPDAFLCEGTLVRDAQGQVQFEPTEFVNEMGLVESRFKCEPFPDAAADNTVTAQVVVPAEGGLVTGPCRDFQVGPARNCGFARRGGVITCTPGATVTVSCEGGSDAAPAAVRVCEASHLLGAIPCLFADALGRGVATADPLEVTFTCPAARSMAETGGLAFVYVGPLIGGDDVSGVTCATRR